MQFKSFIPFLLVPFAAAFTTEAASLDERASAGDPASLAKLLGDFKAIAGAIKTFNNSLNEFKPNSPSNFKVALDIGNEGLAIEDALDSGIQHAKAARKLNSAQSTKIATATLRLLPHIKSLLANTIAHRKSFATVGFAVDLSKQVHTSLVHQKSLSLQFGRAVAAKLTPEFAAQAPTINKEIAGYFNKAIAVFSKCTGLVCAPGFGGGGR